MGERSSTVAIAACLAIAASLMTIACAHGEPHVPVPSTAASIAPPTPAPSAPPTAPPPTPAAAAPSLATFFRDRWVMPAAISLTEAKALCVTYRVSVSRDLVIWHVRKEPVKPSGNDLFDESARVMLEKLVEDRTPLPEPPPDLPIRGRTVDVVLSGGTTGDASRCL